MSYAAPLKKVEAMLEKARAGLRFRRGLVCCRVCGCTELEPCCPPCGWAGQDICTHCAEAVAQIMEWTEGAYRPNLTALVREVKRWHLVASKGRAAVRSRGAS